LLLLLIPRERLHYRNNSRLPRRLLPLKKLLRPLPQPKKLPSKPSLLRLKLPSKKLLPTSRKLLLNFVLVVKSSRLELLKSRLKSPLLSSPRERLH